VNPHASQRLSTWEQRVRRLPAQVDLLPFETFDSWCARVLKANAITSFELQDILIEARFFRVPESNLRSAGWASLDTYLAFG
jgi:predicted nucleic acid-binding protein